MKVLRKFRCTKDRVLRSGYQLAVISSVGRHIYTSLFRVRNTLRLILLDDKVAMLHWSV